MLPHDGGACVASDPEAMAMLQRLAARQVSAQEFRAALLAVPERDRDAWFDRLLGLDELPDDDPGLPRGCVPYLPSSVDTLLRMIELADVRADDVFVDVGSGLGRAMALTHLATGAAAIGLEIQAGLVRRTRELASRLNTRRMSVIEGDATSLTRHIGSGSVFFLYCPFSGERLERVVDDLGSIARTRVIRVCAVALPLPSRSWLAQVAYSGDLAVYSSRC